MNEPPTGAEVTLVVTALGLSGSPQPASRKRNASSTAKLGASAVQMVKMFGRDQTRLGTLYFDVIHNNEMYGQIVVYYRAKGLTPPSTADRPNMGKKKE